MPAYMVFEIEVTDPAAWAEYRAVAGPLMAAAGGRFVLWGTGAEPLADGWAPAALSVVEFPDRAAARALFDSPEYRAVLPLRARAARMRGTLVEAAGAPP